MRKFLIAVPFAVLLGAAPVQAATPVTDAGSYINELKQLAQQVQSYQAELQQLQWAISLTTNLVHAPNLGNVMGLANLLGVDSSLPINPYALQGLVSGYGGMNSIGALAGKLGNLGNLVTTTYGNDNVYSCKTNSFSCTQSNARMASSAGIKGIGSQITTDLQNHLPVLAGLRERLATAANPKDVADVQAQIGIEQTWVNSEQAQLQSVAMLSEAQGRVFDEQQRQKFMRDADTLIAAVPN